MKIESTPDKLVIPAPELQEVVKAYILAQTGREVQGVVRYEMEDITEIGAARRNSATAWCYLAPRETA